jgi:hypothetical protein
MSAPPADQTRSRGVEHRRHCPTIRPAVGDAGILDIVTARNLAKGRRQKNDPITPEDKREVAQDFAERKSIQKKRGRARKIRVMRVKHSAGLNLLPFIDDLCRQLAASGVALDGIADLLEEKASELRQTARKGRDRIVPEVDRIRPKLAEANRLAKNGIAVDKIDKEVGLTKWINEVDAKVTVREIFEEIMRPKRHEFWVEAYWLVGKMQDVELGWRSVKRFYGQHRRNRR